MTHGIRYSLNREMAPADNARTFEDFESARHYLVSHFRERIYETAESARFSGTIFDRLPMVSPDQAIDREGVGDAGTVPVGDGEFVARAL